MSIEFALPELGENVETADVVQVLVTEGEELEAGRNVLELETEKAVVEVPCPHGGRVERIHVRKGDKVTVGQAILTIGEAASPDRVEEPARPAKAARAARPGPTGKARAAGKAERVEEAGPPAETETPKAAEAERARPGLRSAPQRAAVPAAPATRGLARELGIELSEVAGSGPDGLITEDDVRRHVRERMSAGAVASAGAPAERADASRFGPVRRVPLESVRRRTAEAMARSWSTVPHVTHVDQADVGALEDLRRKHGESGRAATRLTMTPFIVRAVAKALRELPELNSSLDLERGELVFHDYRHIGVAVDTEHGLFVPVVRDADRKGVEEIAAELADLAARARERKLAPEEMQGGTFTVTNLGGIGGIAFTPIVYHPQVAILGVARSRQEPAIEDGKLVARLLLPLCLSYDHRVVDGALGARFARRVAEILSTPVLLM